MFPLLEIMLIATVRFMSDSIRISVDKRYEVPSTRFKHKPLDFADALN